MALRKSDLYASLWRSCDELRGGMDASQYKDYVLTLLFLKYVSDRHRTDPDALLDLPDGCSFEDIVALRGKPNIGEGIDTIIGAIAEANDLAGVIDAASFNDDEKLGRGKEMVDRLSQLVGIFSQLDFAGSGASGDDLLGDAYEYLMRHFATESGKSKGQFYTPAEVSRILAKVVGIGPGVQQHQTVYDPTCGSGSLLLKAADESPRGMSIYGQEKDGATWALARMNMILHGYETAELAKGDAITSPQFVSGGALRAFDFIVANPPFSVKSWSSGLEDDLGRFEFGRPPDKNGDYAFLLHALASLKSTGTAAIILPHGVLFRGNAEALIRRELVRRGYVKGIIGLPPNLFYGTGIPACIVVLDKRGAAGRRAIMMIDASRGFIKDGAKNRLRSRDIHQIVDVFTTQTEVPRYSRLVPIREIAEEANAYSLNIPRYVDSSESEDRQDLHAHLHGGIPERDIDALSDYWEAFPSLRATLFTLNRPGYVDLAVDPAHVADVILGSDEFRAFSEDVQVRVAAWFDVHRVRLEGIDAETDPRELIQVLGDDLLERMDGLPLIDRYAVYEHLLSYWHDTMHDDVALVIQDGWVEAARPRPARVLGSDKNGKDKYEEAHIKRGRGASTERWVMDLVAPDLVENHLFPSEQRRLLDALAAEETAAGQLDEYIAIFAIEDGPAWDAVDDAGKVTKKSCAQALKQARAALDEEATEALSTLLEHINQAARLKAAAKSARAGLDEALISAYSDLDAPMVRALVLDDKWAATIGARVADEISTLGMDLVARIRSLGQRYRETQGAIEAEMQVLASGVRRHMAAMGVER